MIIQRLIPNSEGEPVEHNMRIAPDMYTVKKNDSDMTVYIIGNVRSGSDQGIERYIVKLYLMDENGKADKDHDCLVLVSDLAGTWETPQEASSAAIALMENDEMEDLMKKVEYASSQIDDFEEAAKELEIELSSDKLNTDVEVKYSKPKKKAKDIFNQPTEEEMIIDRNSTPEDIPNVEFDDTGDDDIMELDSPLPHDSNSPTATLLKSIYQELFNSHIESKLNSRGSNVPRPFGSSKPIHVIESRLNDQIASVVSTAVKNRPEKIDSLIQTLIEYRIECSK